MLNDYSFNFNIFNPNVLLQIKAEILERFNNNLHSIWP